MENGFLRKYHLFLPWRDTEPLHRGTSVKKRVEATTPRDFFLTMIAAVNTDVSNAVSIRRVSSHAGSSLTHIPLLAVHSYEDPRSSTERPCHGYVGLATICESRKFTNERRLMHRHRCRCSVLRVAIAADVLKSQSAFLGHFDFIYALPTAWLSVPFTFLGEH